MIKDIGSRIAALRKNKQFSQEELASLLGVSRQTISKWENQEVLPDSFNIVGLSKIFNVPTDEILLGKVQSDYRSTNILSDTRKRRYKARLIGRIIMILSFLIFLPPAIILPFVEMSDMFFSITLGLLLTVFLVLFSISIMLLSKSKKLKEECLYIEELERQKQFEQPTTYN